MNSFFYTERYENYVMAYENFKKSWTLTELENNERIAKYHDFILKTSQATESFISINNGEKLELNLELCINEALDSKDEVKMFFLVSVTFNHDVGNINKSLQKIIGFLWEKNNKQILDSLELELLSRILESFIIHVEESLRSSLELILKITNDDGVEDYLNKADALLIELDEL